MRHELLLAAVLAVSPALAQSSAPGAAASSPPPAPAAATAPASAAAPTRAAATPAATTPAAATPAAERAEPAAPGPTAAIDSERWAKLDAGARREHLASMSQEQLAAVLDGLSADVLLSEGMESVEALGTYSAKLVKQERVDGTLMDSQTLEVWVRQSPFAVRMDYVGGPSKGRRVLYSTAIREKELRVKEPGVKGVFGALWIDIDSGLTRADSNHRVTDMGLAAVVRLLQKDFALAEKFGGFQRKNEGFNKRGHYCIRFDAPSGAKGLTATYSRVCIDGEHVAPMFVEVYDAKGLYERYEWFDLKKRSVAKDYFTLEGADL